MNIIQEIIAEKDKEYENTFINNSSLIGEFCYLDNDLYRIMSSFGVLRKIDRINEEGLYEVDHFYGEECVTTKHKYARLVYDKRLRFCNDYCVENPLQEYDFENKFFTYDTLEGVEDYLGYYIPENIKTRILNQQQEWEKCYEKSPPENLNYFEVERLRNVAVSIMEDLRKNLTYNIELTLFDEVLQKDVVIE